jgi:hypothetical protein
VISRKDEGLDERASHVRRWMMPSCWTEAVIVL